MTVLRDGTVGGDGACESWSFRTDKGTVYVYAVDGRVRYGEHWNDGLPWDVEVMYMPNGDSTDIEYENPLINSLATYEEADAYARSLAERIEATE